MNTISRIRPTHTQQTLSSGSGVDSLPMELPIHETLTFKDDRLANCEMRYVGDGHRSRPCWGAGGDQRLLQLSNGTKGSLLCVEVV